MPISWNEIRHNAVAFSKSWAGVSSERAEAKTFWDEFFLVFGLKRRLVASFEEPVKKISGTWGFIDLFWKATLLVEHKTRGLSLEKAESQAMDYIQALKNEHRDDDIPRYVIISDFARIALHDLEEGTTFQFQLADFHQNIDKFAFMPGYKQHRLDVEDPINIDAVELLGKLHDALKEGGYSGHDLERFLVRILFCLFAEDTGLFERNMFTDYIENHTAEDGSNLGEQLANLFHVLNTEKHKRQKKLLEELAELPYVNGDLFAEQLGFAAFDRNMRNRLRHCCRFDWSRISPAMFGSLFQSVMLAPERRQIGAHYTSERDILKQVRSLFLDTLLAEFESIKGEKKKLQEFHRKLGQLRFLDPACGCGNFLVVTYRELRLLEIDVLKTLFRQGEQFLDIETALKLNVDQMYGIEIKEFPARVAEVAMWLIDHQMNTRVSAEFGNYFARLPLVKSPHIVNDNALRIDWKNVLPSENCSYVMGNPPFVGKKARNREQVADMQMVFGAMKGAGELDYVCCWYIRAAEYLAANKSIEAAFVSTNSITQGEQPGLLWPLLLARGVRIIFAHRTFSWESEARGKAHVHVVIIGFGYSDRADKRIIDYESGSDHAVTVAARRINPYLVDANNTLLKSIKAPICATPKMRFGNMPNDDGNFLFDDEEKRAFLKHAPKAEPLFRQFVSAKEYLGGVNRWCLWLKNVSPNLIRSIPAVMERVEAVRDFRAESQRPATRKLAGTPTLFGEIRQGDSPFVVIPLHSSENRRFIPMTYYSAGYIVNNSCSFIENCEMYHFGVLSSTMHMAWVRQVCGRIKSDFRYSIELVYNNFPWPASTTSHQRAVIDAKAQAVLDARAKHPGSTLSDLYDPLTMPPNLTKAHADLDRAVDACYRDKPFDSDRERVEFLFALYEKLIEPLTANVKKMRKPKKPD
jgi:hypothetical protein